MLGLKLLVLRSKMPEYAYVCLACGEKIEFLCKNEELSKEEKKLRCKKCGGKTFKRKLAPFVTHFNYTRGK